ncbi:MAG TPA: PDDEXK nuclease domain-containing protein [bacterium]
MSKKPTIKNNKCYLKIKSILEEARHSVYRHVNFVMVQAYWNIGRVIVKEELKGKSKAEYGEYLLKELSIRLTKDFGKGFTETNLRYMRLFYLSFEIVNAARSQSLPDKIHHALRDESVSTQKDDAVRRELPVVRPELSWTHYRLLLKVDRPDVRKFYLDECIDSNWSTRQLERQINSFYYERLLVSKNKKPVKREADMRAKELSVSPEEQIKDPYVLEFLGLKEISYLKERRLEQALIDHLQKFLLELGRGFSFVARQMRISTETQHFYIDLIFYNYLLKCFVIIDLKTSKLTHQDIGQMDMYVRIFEDKMKQPGDNPTIGIILCTEKDATVVKYSVLKDSRKIFASKYKLYLPSEKELRDEIEREKQILRLSFEKNK